MNIPSRLTTTQRIAAAFLGMAIFGLSTPASAADLGSIRVGRAKHVYITRTDWSWRDRCAYAGYYCLYAEYGFVYAYPFDDRPVAHVRYRRHVR